MYSLIYSSYHSNSVGRSDDRIYIKYLQEQLESAHKALSRSSGALSWNEVAHQQKI
jgi:hypothetical protein